MGEEPALAHGKFQSEAPDRQTLESLSRCDMDSGLEDGFSRTFTLGLTTLRGHLFHCFSELCFGQEGILCFLSRQYIARTFVLRQELRWADVDRGSAPSTVRGCKFFNTPAKGISE